MATITHITDKDFPLFASGDQFVSGQKIFLIQPNKSFWVDSENLDSSRGWLYIDQNDSSIGYHNNAISFNDYDIQVYGIINFDNVPTVNGTGVLLSGEIPPLPNTIVYTTGNQTISGTKNFVDNVYIKNLFVTGTETIVSTTNFNVQSPYLLLNLTGGAVDGGIFFVTGSGLTGINDYGPIIGFDHSKNFKFGIARRSDDLSTLNDIAAVQDITNYSGFVSNNYVTKSNGQFSNRPTVNGTGVLLVGEASSASLPSTILYTSGNQIKSGRLIIGDDAGSIVDPNSPYTLSLQTNSPATWLEILNNSGANKGVFFGIQDNDFEQYNWQGGDIKFFTSENPSAGSERLIIKNDGKVGIDTHSPSEKLEVAGNIKVTNSGFFASGIKVGNNSIIITENRIDGGYNASNGNLIDGLLGIQYSGYFDNDPEWFKTATIEPIINELVLTGVSASGTYTRVSNIINQGTSYFQGPNSWAIRYYSQAPLGESYWYLSPNYSTGYFTSLDLKTWSLAQNIPAWNGGGTYNINDIVSHGGSNWICKAYAPVGYGPFGGYLDGTANGTDYWDELPATQTSTVTQTQNSENSTVFNADRALLNGTSWEWVGYFVPQVTESYNFYLGQVDEAGYFWIGDKALNGYTTGNADLINNSNVQNLLLNSGQSYPVRLQWGHPITPTNLGIQLGYEITNLSFYSYDWSGVFFHGSVGKGFYIDAVSGDASFAGNVQANSATFNVRPTVNGTGVLLSGEAASLPTTIVYTTGDQIISGNKDFYGDEILFSGLNVIFAENTGVSYGQWQFSNRPTVNGTGVLLSGEASAGTVENVVYTTGDQNISGIKTFASRPTVNGTGVLLNGEAYPSNNPSGYITNANVVYTTGNQTISGNKDFYGDEILFSGVNVIFADNTGVSYGQWQFSNRPTVNGTGVLLSGETSAGAVENAVYTTGDQTINGIKTFTSTETLFGNDNIGKVRITDGAHSNEIGLLTMSDEIIAVKMSDGSFQYGGNNPGNGPLSILNDIATFTNRPTINGTGVLLSGEISQLPETIVYTNNDQTITGLKTFISGISIGGPSQLSTPTIKIFDAANSGYSTFYWEDAQLYINDVSNRSLYYDFSKYSTGTMQTIAVVKDLETTGSTLNTKINSLSGYVTGVTGTFGASVNALNTYAVLTTGNQTISGIKTFATGVDILSIGTGLRIIYGTGTNSGEFGILDWSNGQFRINTLGVGSGTTKTVAVGTASSFGSAGVGLYVNTPSNQVSLNASQNSVRVSSSNVEIYARNAGATATSLHLSAGGDLVRINKLIANSGADIYFSGTTGTGASASSIGVLVSGLWNNTGQTYTGVRYNITLDSGASGLVPNTTNSLLNLAVNNTGVFNVNSKGQVLINQLGNALSENTLDIRRGGTSIATLRDDGTFGALATVSAGGTLAAPALTMTSTTVRVGSNCTFAWTNASNNAFGTTDLVLNRDAPNIMAQRNGLSAQQFRVYNYTGTNSGEFGVFGWQVTGSGQPNALVIGAQASQSGILRDVILTGRNINISSSGVIIPNPTVPTSTGSAGARGQISWDDDFIYVCVSGNSWKRSALTTW